MQNKIIVRRYSIRLDEMIYKYDYQLQRLNNLTNTNTVKKRFFKPTPMLILIGYVLFLTLFPLNLTLAMKIDKIHSYLVHAGKGSDEQQPVKGADIPLSGNMYNMLQILK